MGCGQGGGQEQRAVPMAPRSPLDLSPPPTFAPAQNEKLMYEIAQENKRLSEPLTKALKEVELLRQQLANHEKDKTSLGQVWMGVDGAFVSIPVLRAVYAEGCGMGVGLGPDGAWPGGRMPGSVWGGGVKHGI
jgi:hypothetical protein